MVDRLQRYVGMNVAMMGPSEGDTSGRYGQDVEFVPRQRLQGVFRRGKFMVFMLEDRALLAHNAMSGYWDELDDPWTFDYVEGKRKPAETDVRAMIELEDPRSHKTFILQFHDSRKFGSLKVLTPEELSKKLSTLGPDALPSKHLYEPTTVVDEERFDGTLDSNRPVKDLLMDQSRIAGVGNIYAAEALWRAKMSPFTPGAALFTKERNELLGHIQCVLREALDRKLDYGSLSIYRRKKCPRCDGDVACEKLKGRATYYCQRCQG